MTSSGDKPASPPPEVLQERLEGMVWQLGDNLHKETTRQIEDLKSQRDQAILDVTSSGDKSGPPSPEVLRERLQELLGQLGDNLDKKRLGKLRS